MAKSPTDSMALWDGRPPSICSVHCLINSIKLLASWKRMHPLSAYPSKSHSATTTRGNLAMWIKNTLHKYHYLLSTMFVRPTADTVLDGGWRTLGTNWKRAGCSWPRQRARRRRGLVAPARRGGVGNKKEAEIKRKKWPEDNLAMSGSTAGEDRMQKQWTSWEKVWVIGIH